MPPEKVLSPKRIRVFKPSIPEARVKYLIKLPLPFSLCLNTNFLFILKLTVLLISLAPIFESMSIRLVGNRANTRLKIP